MSAIENAKGDKGPVGDKGPEGDKVEVVQTLLNELKGDSVKKQLKDALGITG